MQTLLVNLEKGNISPALEIGYGMPHFFKKGLVIVNHTFINGYHVVNRNTGYLKNGVYFLKLVLQNKTHTV